MMTFHLLLFVCFPLIASYGELYLIFKVTAVRHIRPVRSFEKKGEGGANLRVFTKRVRILRKLTKISGVNSFSGEKLHDFEIICPAMGVHSSPAPAYGPASALSNNLVQ